LRRRLPRGRRRALCARPGLDHRRDGRRALARHGAEPADRRRHRRAESTHRRPGAPERTAVRRAGRRLLCGLARALPRRRLPARARAARRPAPPRRGFLHDERRDQRRLCSVRDRGRTHMISVRKLGKSYGEKRVLRGVDLELPRGGFAVVTGPNGSGKTTLLRICAGLALPSVGEAHVDAERAQVGYLGHEPLVYRELTALENLELYGRLYRVPERRERIGMLLERYGLWDVRHDRVASYSRGMTQRLALCRVLLHEPDLLVLDEPYPPPH